MDTSFCTLLVTALAVALLIGQIAWLLLGRRIDGKHWIRLGFFPRLAVRTVWLLAGLGIGLFLLIAIANIVHAQCGMPPVSR